MIQYLRDCYDVFLVSAILKQNGHYSWETNGPISEREILCNECRAKSYLLIAQWHSLKWKLENCFKFNLILKTILIEL